MALQDTLVQRHRSAEIANFAARKDAGAVAAVLVENDGHRQFVVVGGEARFARTSVTCGGLRGVASEAVKRRLRVVHVLRDEARHRAPEQIEPQQMNDRDQARQRLRAFEPLRHAGVAAMMGGELAHRHHAFPLGDRHEKLAAAAVAEFAERLRGLVLFVWRKVAGAQHEAGFALHRRQHLVELAFEATALRRPVAQEDPEIIGEAGAVTHGQVEGRQFVAEFEALRP